MNKDNLKHRLDELFSSPAEGQPADRPGEPVSPPAAPEGAAPLPVAAHGAAEQLQDAVGASRHGVEEELRESKALTWAILESALDCVIAIDHEGRIIEFNPAAEKTFGYRRDEVMGKEMAGLIVPLSLRDQHRRGLAHYLATGEGPVLGKRIEITAMRADGSEFPIELAITPLHFGRRPVFTAYLREITERKWAEEEREQLLTDLASRALQLQTAAEVSHAASSILSLDELLPQVVELIRERFDLYYVGIFLVDEAERYAVLRAGTGQAGRLLLGRGHQLTIGDSSIPPTDGDYSVIGWCIANRQARIALDVGEEAVRFDNPWLPETRSELALPLISRGQVLGAMTVQSAKEAAFSETDVTVLQTMADQVANAIANAHLFEQTQRRVAELATINAINQALTSHLELRAMLSLVVEKIHHIFDVPSAYIALYDSQTNLVEIPCMVEGDQSLAIDPFPLGQGLTSVVIQRRQPLLIRARDDIERRSAELGTTVAGGKPAESYLGVPILVGHEVIGVICIQDSETQGAFGAAEERLLSTIAPSVGIAIQNARLFEQTQQRVADLTIIEKTMSALAATLTREETIDTLLPNVASAVQADAVSLFLLEGEQMIRIGTLARPGDEAKDAAIGQAIPLADYPLTRQVIETRRPLAFLADDPRLREHVRQAFAAAGITASATIPLIGREGVVGSLAVSLRQPGRAFTERDLSLLQTLADQASVALEKVRLLEETYRLARRTQLINQIAGKMREAVSVDEVLRIAVDELRQATQSTRAVARLGSAGSANGDGQPDGISPGVTDER